jgi:hypothetical protein
MTVGAGNHPPAGDNSTTNPGTQGHVNKVLRAFSDAITRLRKRSERGIVPDRDLQI